MCVRLRARFTVPEKLVVHVNFVVALWYLPMLRAFYKHGMIANNSQNFADLCEMNGEVE